MRKIVSESVGKGHPDKICDQISDAVLDACLRQDPDSKVACEVMAANRVILVGGEITTKATVNIEEEVWRVIKPLGYTETDFTIICNINKQSPEINSKVTANTDAVGAGDQGITTGYATNETDNCLPLSIDIANYVLFKLEEARTTINDTTEVAKRLTRSNLCLGNELDNWDFAAVIKADMKSQVELAYDDENSKPTIQKLILAIQHKDLPDAELAVYWSKLAKYVSYLVETKYGLSLPVDKIFINHYGKFTIGGPIGDTGLTGRKLQVDTYGTVVNHGGGAFCGKDSSKVDRTGAYLARWIAKSIVKSNLADKCLVTLSWEIGAPKPDTIDIDCFGTNKIDLDKIYDLVDKKFHALDLKWVIDTLQLKQPIYLKTATFGHFTDQNLPWEQTINLED